MDVLLNIATEQHVLNVDEILYWVGALGAILAVASAIILPVRKMLSKYDSALNRTEDLLKEQSNINSQYQSLIDESKEDRKQLNASIAAIKKATLTQIKLQIGKIMDDALKRGWVWKWECQTVEMLFESYSPLGGNGFTATSLEKFRNLPVKYRDKKCSDEIRDITFIEVEEE